MTKATVSVQRRNKLWPPDGGKGGGFLIEAMIHITASPRSIHAEDVDLKTITSMFLQPANLLANSSIAGSIANRGSTDNYASINIGSTAGAGTAMDLYGIFIGH